MFKRSLIGAFLAITLVGLVTWTLGSASGAGYNRATTTCAKDGYDSRPVPSGFIAQVDSIVSFGQAQSAHKHGFYGRHDISSTMSAKIPLNAAHLDDPGYQPPAFDNCATYGDWAAYWFPTPKFNGVDIAPAKLTNTYQAPAGVTVAVPPFGETFVAGDSHATSEATMSSQVSFTCGNIDVTYTKPTDCTGVPGGVVTAQVKFPDCTDGQVGYDPVTHTYPGFDTPTGIAPSHFSYSVNGVCPAGTVPCVPGTLMAQLVTQQTFIDPRTNSPMVNPYNADGTLGLSFSSGPYYTYHADYINTWNHVLGTIVDQCLNRALSCSVVNNVPIQ
jgi:hypothetical protein